MKTGCWFCGKELIWGCDFSFEDYGIEGEGIVATRSCPSCGASAEFYTKVE
jgi:transcription elongation factor Elf1